MDNEREIEKKNVLNAIRVLNEKYMEKPNTIRVNIPDGYYNPNDKFELNITASNRDGSFIISDDIIRSVKLAYKGDIISGNLI